MRELSVVRAIVGVAGLAIAASPAFALFQGLSIREDKSFSPAAQALYPVGGRTFNIYATFDGDSTDDIRNTVLSVGQPDDVTGWGVDTVKNPGGAFFQTGAPFSGDTAPSSGFFGFEPTLEFDTFVTIGLKDNLNGDATVGDPDFSMGPAAILGGWANNNPPSLQGDPLNVDGEFLTLLAQITIVDLQPGAPLGFSMGQNNDGVWQFGTSIFGGSFSIFRQGDTSVGENPAIELQVEFVDIPAPGVGVTLGVLGLALARRRRSV